MSSSATTGESTRESKPPPAPLPSSSSPSRGGIVAAHRVQRSSPPSPPHPPPDRSFPPEILQSLYASIQEDQIRLFGSGEHHGTGFERRAYEEAVRSLERAGCGYVVGTAGLLDREMFNTCWGPAVASLAAVFDVAEHPALLHSAADALRCCARIAAANDVPGVFDCIIMVRRWARLASPATRARPHTHT